MGCVRLLKVIQIRWAFTVVPGSTSQMRLFIYFMVRRCPNIGERLWDYLTLGSAEYTKNHKTTIGLKRISRGYYQMSTAVSYSCGSKHAVLCFLYFYHIPITFSFCQFFLDILCHLCLVAATPPTDYLICSFMLSENCVAPSVGHCSGAEFLTGRGKEALMGKGEGNNFQLQAEKLRLRRP